MSRLTLCPAETKVERFMASKGAVASLAMCMILSPRDSQACHGPDGKADTPAGKSMKIRSFSDSETKKLCDDELAAVIEKGKNRMPAYGKSMKPDEIKAMVAYIRSVAK